MFGSDSYLHLSLVKIMNEMYLKDLSDLTGFHSKVKHFKSYLSWKVFWYM